MPMPVSSMRNMTPPSSSRCPLTVTVPGEYLVALSSSAAITEPMSSAAYPSTARSVTRPIVTWVYRSIAERAIRMTSSSDVVNPASSSSLRPARVRRSRLARRIRVTAWSTW
jgi:hypothetical protein